MPKDYDHDWRHKDDKWKSDNTARTLWKTFCKCACCCPLYAVVEDGLCGYCADGHHYDEALPL